MINDNDETFKHEGFGMISIGRVHCGGSGQVLYGSNVSHHEYIQLKISTGYLNRHLNRDWFHEDKTLIEINLSPVQFAEMISVGMNNGSTPCTLTWFNGKIGRAHV